MRQWIKISIISILTGTLLFLGVYFYIVNNHVDVFDENDDGRNPLADDPYIYKDDKQEETDEIYIIVLKQNKNSDEEKISFEEMNSFRAGEDIHKTKMKVYFESKDKGFFENGTILRESNGTIEIRGKESEKAPQKSFKIRLFDRVGLWHNQNIINLNKHYFDGLRIRNKLSFDYFKIIPNMVSFRTRFVRLFIKDLTLEQEQKAFDDYGLFTQIEQPNKLFLRNHGLDPNAQLYQAEDFEFSRYPDIIKTKEDPAYSKEKFEEILEINGNEEHQKLIDMLEAVNDYDRDINEIVETYFDKENYLTWIGASILFDQHENSSSDFILYSPLNLQKWYFIPWDYDEAWGGEEDRPKWQKGLSVYWNNVLHRRFFEDPQNVEALSNKIEELRSIINEKQTKAFLDSYKDILLSNITKLTDLKYLPITLDEYKEEYEELPKLTEKNRLYYYELLEKPMPFYLLEPERKESKYIFKWNESFDLQGDSLVYDFELSQDKGFANIMKNIKDMKDPQTVIEGLQKGVYYWRVTARDTNGNTQIAFDTYRDEYGEKYYGIKQLDTNKVKEMKSGEEIVSEDVISMDETKTVENELKPEELKTADKENSKKTTVSNKKPTKTYRTYKIKTGETLFSVSVKFYGNNNRVEEIKKLNNIKDINNISVGTVLKLP